jgi:hypothetical protein
MINLTNRIKRREKEGKEVNLMLKQPQILNLQEIA